MDTDDLEPDRHGFVRFSLGGDLSLMGKGELQAYRAVLAAEIDRIDAEIVKKDAARAQASAFFKQGTS